MKRKAILQLGGEQKFNTLYMKLSKYKTVKNSLDNIRKANSRSCRIFTHEQEF